MELLETVESDDWHSRTFKTGKTRKIERIHKHQPILEIEYLEMGAMWIEDKIMAQGVPQRNCFVMHGMADIVGRDQGRAVWTKSEQLALIKYGKAHNHGDTFIEANGSSTARCDYKGHFIYGLLNLDTGKGVGFVYPTEITVKDWKVWWDQPNMIGVEFFPKKKIGRRWIFVVDNGKEELLRVGKEIVDRYAKNVEERQTPQVAANSQVGISAGERAGRSCLVATTSSATYFVDRASGGLVSLLDHDGVDWVNWSNKPGASGEFRGIPNAVNGKGRRYEGFGHPGFDVAASEIVSANSIRTSTPGTEWSLLWEFFDQHATLTMEKVPVGEAYWILYEGVPGGQYDKNQLADIFWGTDQDGRRSDRPALGSASSATGRWKWLYWGHTKRSRVLFMQRQTDDGRNDLMAYMNAKQTLSDGMIVFGFGRGPNTESQLRLPNKFALGFVESVAHDAIAAGIRSLDLAR